MEYFDWEISCLDLRKQSVEHLDLRGFDTILHFAGKAHADVSQVTEEVKQEYYKVNTELTMQLAEKARREGVSQFVYLSSIIIYGEGGKLGEEKRITHNTIPSPANFYGDSKWQADQGVQALATDSFGVAILRLPMVYGKDSKGNYKVLEKMARKLPIFPNMQNKRSILHIDRLCQNLGQVVNERRLGVLFPKDPKDKSTAEMVEELARNQGKKLYLSSLLNPLVIIAYYLGTSKIKKIIQKAFGSIVIESNDFYE